MTWTNDPKPLLDWVSQWFLLKQGLVAPEPIGNMDYEQILFYHALENECYEYQDRLQKEKLREMKRGRK